MSEQSRGRCLKLDHQTEDVVGRSDGRVLVLDVGPDAGGITRLRQRMSTGKIHQSTMAKDCGSSALCHQVCATPLPIFERLMERILEGLHRQSALVYLDDAIVRKNPSVVSWLDCYCTYSPLVILIKLGTLCRFLHK